MSSTWQMATFFFLQDTAVWRSHCAHKNMFILSFSFNILDAIKFLTFFSWLNLILFPYFLKFYEIRQKKCRKWQHFYQPRSITRIMRWLKHRTSGLPNSSIPKNINKFLWNTILMVFKTKKLNIQKEIAIIWLLVPKDTVITLNETFQLWHLSAVPSSGAIVCFYMP